ncbi:MAG TPA: M28 family peptidase [Gemmatimonadaceae bacterium]|nr:M28 family peptidase [Gemmatimonadaceae bacterium]
MRSIAIIVTAAIAGVACSGDAQRGSAATKEPAGGATAFNGTAALAYAKAQFDFGPRVPGTPAAKKAGDWIIAQMRSRADTVIVQSWTHTTASGKKLPMRNILARFRPELPERVLYVTHWDSRPISEAAASDADRKLPVPGANDGASGVGLFIALGDVLKQQKPTVGVDLLFVDGEDYGEFGPPEVDVLIGSAYFASHLPSPDYKPLFGVVWDMIGDSDLRIPYEAHSFQRAPEVVARVWQTAADLGYGSIFVQESGGPVTDDHIPLLNAGLRVIDVIDLTYDAHHTQMDTMDKVSARSLAIVGDVATALVTRP